MTAETITYPEMNAKLVDLLRWDKGNSMLLYAAQRIEELEQIASVQGGCLKIARRALEHYDHLGLAIPEKALAQIDEHLAELKPEGEAE